MILEKTIDILQLQNVKHGHIKFNVINYGDKKYQEGDIIQDFSECSKVFEEQLEKYPEYNVLFTGYDPSRFGVEKLYMLYECCFMSSLKVVEKYIGNRKYRITKNEDRTEGKTLFRITYGRATDDEVE